MPTKTPHILYYSVRICMAAIQMIELGALIGIINSQYHAYMLLYCIKLNHSNNCNIIRLNECQSDQ